MIFHQRYKVPKSDASILFVFLAIVATLILASIILSISTEKKIAVNEYPEMMESVARKALPVGISEPIVSIRIEPSVLPTWLFSYYKTGQRSVGLVRWDNKDGKYNLISESVLNKNGIIVGNPEITLRYPNWEVDAVVELRWGTGFSGEEVIFLIAIDGNRLIPITFADNDEQDLFSSLAVGLVGDDLVEMLFIDVDGDESEEIEVTTMTSDGDLYFDIFVWRGDGILQRSEILSEAMKVTEEIFID